MGAIACLTQEALPRRKEADRAVQTRGIKRQAQTTGTITERNDEPWSDADDVDACAWSHAEWVVDGVQSARGGKESRANGRPIGIATWRVQACRGRAAQPLDFPAWRGCTSQIVGYVVIATVPVTGCRFEILLTKKEATASARFFAVARKASADAPAIGNTNIGDADDQTTR